MQGRTEVTINDYEAEVAYTLSIGAKINDLGLPWTADTHSIAEIFRISDKKI